MDKADIDRIKAAVDLAALIGQHLKLEQEGIHWKACCPFHEEKTASFTVTPDKGIWKCFGCGAEGDAFSFIQKFKNVGFKEALAEVQKFAGQSPTPEKKEKPKEKFDIITPIPKGKEPPGFFGDEQAESHFPYTDQQGNIIAYAVRFKNPEMKNLYLAWVKYEGGKQAFKYTWLPKPRPLFNLHKLAHFPKHQVIAVEGEKKADALQKVVGNLLVIIAWMGGANGARHADWSPVHGRKIVIWPDADKKNFPETHKQAGTLMPQEFQPGFKAANDINNIIWDKVAGLRFIKPPEGKPDGWDCYNAVHDDKMTREQLIKFIKENNYQPAKPEPEKKPSAPPPPGPPPPPESESFDELNDPFQCLGYDHGTYFYLSKGTRQVLPIKISEHKSNILGLAPLDYWERKYPARTGPDWTLAVNELLRECERKGVYDMQSIRGRGAWYDAGRSVLHFGNKLLVNGKYHPILNFKSRYVYEAGIQVEHNIGSPLKTAEANKLIRLIKLFYWKKPLHADLMAGFCVLAPICGAIPWRPHVWLTGGAGTGKTYTVKNIIEPCIGSFRLYVQGNTTEAGLRQTLKSDAMPILFDESEGEDQSAIKRIKAVLDLMKQSSSDTGGNILKGTTSGRAMSFQIRSMFCMSSVGLSITDEAARGRISILELDSPDKEPEELKAHFETLNQQIIKIISDKYCADLRARTIRLIPVIRKNINVFIKAAASHFKKQRTADQYGTLLAGAYTLWDHNIVTYEQALKFIQSQDWEEIDTDDNDPMDCLNTILQTTIRWGGSSQEISIAECLESANGPDLGGSDYISALARNGIRLQNNIIYISDSHRMIKNILKETQWPKMWARILRRIHGSVTKKSMRFFGPPTSATGIPWEKVFTEAPEGQQFNMGFQKEDG